MRKATVLGGIGAVIALTAGGSAGAATQWYGLAAPHYTARQVRACNADFATASRNITEARADQAVAAVSSIIDGYQFMQESARHLRVSRAALADLRKRGCPDAGYPLKTAQS